MRDGAATAIVVKTTHEAFVRIALDKAKTLLLSHLRIEAKPKLAAARTRKAGLSPHDRGDDAPVTPLAAQATMGAGAIQAAQVLKTGPSLGDRTYAR